MRIDIFRKTDLLGLTPLQNNTAQSLPIALLLKFRSIFEGVLIDNNNNQLTDENNTPIIGQVKYDADSFMVT